MSTWVRGSGDTAAAASRSTQQTTTSTVTANKGQRHDRQPRPAKRPRASVWTPQIARDAAETAAKKAADATQHRDGAAAKAARRAAARKAEEEEKEQQANKLLAEAQEISRKRQRKEQSIKAREETRQRKEKEAEMRVRDAAAATASAMEGSVRLKRMRNEYEVKHKDDILRKQQAAEAERKRENTQDEQRQLLTHVLKHHSSYFELLQIPENSSVQVINRARRKLSARVHPDRCQFDRAKDAFHRINQAADKLAAGQ